MQPFAILHAQPRSSLLDLLAPLTDALASPIALTLLCAPLLLGTLVLLRCTVALGVAIRPALPIGSRPVFRAATLLLLRCALPLLVARWLCPSVWLRALRWLLGSIAGLGLIAARRVQFAPWRTTPGRMHSGRRSSGSSTTFVMGLS
jgi:hypothetical protein